MRYEALADWFSVMGGDNVRSWAAVTVVGGGATSSLALVFEGI